MDHHIDSLMDIICMNKYTPMDTPSIQTSLGTDTYCTPLKETDKWNYAVAVGMLNYLSSNSQLDIELVINQVACHTHNPKFSHEI